MSIICLFSKFISCYCLLPSPPPPPFPRQKVGKSPESYDVQTFNMLCGINFLSFTRGKLPCTNINFSSIASLVWCSSPLYFSMQHNPGHPLLWVGHTSLGSPDGNSSTSLQTHTTAACHLREYLLMPHSQLLEAKALLLH